MDTVDDSGQVGFAFKYYYDNTTVYLFALLPFLAAIIATYSKNKLFFNKNDANRSTFEFAAFFACTSREK